MEAAFVSVAIRLSDHARQATLSEYACPAWAGEGCSVERLERGQVFDSVIITVVSEVQLPFPGANGLGHPFVEHDPDAGSGCCVRFITGCRPFLCIGPELSQFSPMAFNCEIAGNAREGRHDVGDRCFPVVLEKDLDSLVLGVAIDDFLVSHLVSLSKDERDGDEAVLR